ncbi:MAG TPA: class I SAM-dependent methyltransferase [Steroidobacteraceae bacterium]|jgi:SAM-dependent methyltransferase|nr:class I SAM-dependent methyltransferase [Steroidobacteraceae bacterium]
MERIPEPELMDDPEQALAYAEADFSVTHGARVEMFRSLMPRLALRGPVLDLGCGAGDVLLRFARAYPEAHFVGIDGSRPMLALAQRAIDAEPALRDRVRVRYGIIPQCQLPQEPWRLIMSHSLLHQLHQPQVLWQTLADCADSADGGCAVFVADLRRPASELDARRMVEATSKNEPEILQRDFFNSLCAAFEPEEVRAQLDAAGLMQLEVHTHDPFHLSISGLL